MTPINEKIVENLMMYKQKYDQPYEKFKNITRTTNLHTYEDIRRVMLNGLSTNIADGALDHYCAMTYKLRKATQSKVYSKQR